MVSTWGGAPTWKKKTKKHARVQKWLPAESGILTLRMPTGSTAVTLSARNGSPQLEELGSYETLKEKTLRAMDWMFVSSQNSYVEILIFNEIVFANRAFGSWLGHESWDFLNRMNAPRKDTPGRSCDPSAMWEHNKKTLPVNQEVGCHQHQTC